jgi:catechol 2,3-dioxygenase-like lactoylglutathione lyase family enzyme
MKYVREMGYAEGNLCTQMLAASADPNTAMVHCEASLDLISGAARSAPKDRSIQSDLANRLGWMSQAYKAKGDLPEAMRQRQLEDAVLEPLMRADPKAADLKRQWAAMQRAMGGLELLMGRPEDARARLLGTRAVVEQIRMVRAGNGPGVELFQYEAPDQDRTFRKNSDWGGHHIAFYVRHIDKAVEYLQTKGAEKRFGPFAVTAGPAAGQTINYFRTPFGTDIELISYPHGMAYQATAPIPLWDPRDNHP